MTLRDRTLVVLAYPNYQELEFWYPVLRSREEGATVRVVAASSDTVESFLGYPVLGDTAPEDVDPTALDALVVPGTVTGRPEPSPAQRELIQAVHAAGVPVYALGSGVALVTDIVDELPAERTGVDADALPDFVSRLHAHLAASPA
jgi:protease I